MQNSIPPKNKYFKTIMHYRLYSSTKLLKKIYNNSNVTRCQKHFNNKLTQTTRQALVFYFSTTEKNQVFYSLIAQNTLNAMAKRLFSLL